MANGINAVYSAAEKGEDDFDGDEEVAENEPDVALLNRLHNMGLLFTRETSTSLVLIISNTPHTQFDINIQDENHVEINFHGERPPSSLFRDLQDFIGISPEEWGIESREVLQTSVSLTPSRAISTDHSKIKRRAYPERMPLHYVITIPFYVQQQEANLHFDRLVIPVDNQV